MLSIAYASESLIVLNPRGSAREARIPIDLPGTRVPKQNPKDNNERFPLETWTHTQWPRVTDAPRSHCVRRFLRVPRYRIIAFRVRPRRPNDLFNYFLWRSTVSKNRLLSVNYRWSYRTLCSLKTTVLCEYEKINRDFRDEHTSLYLCTFRGETRYVLHRGNRSWSGLRENLVGSIAASNSDSASDELLRNKNIL
jgi:hypothetical protein